LCAAGNGVALTFSVSKWFVWVLSAHALIAIFPDRSVYFLGIFEFHPGPSRDIPLSNSTQPGIPTRDPYLAFLPGRKPATKATALTRSDDADADLGTPPTNTTYHDGIPDYWYFCEQLNGPSFILLSAIFSCGLLWLVFLHLVLAFYK
jgi:hypothetical protein